MKNILILLFLLLCSAGCAMQTGNLPELRQQALLAYQEGNYEQARKDLQQLVLDIPADAELWFRLGNACAHTHLPSQAIDAYRNALLRDPHMSKAWYNLALIHLQEAANTYIEMQTYTPATDPVRKKGEYMLEHVLQLLDRKKVMPQAEKGDR